MKLRIFIFGLLLLPSLVSANIVINEIMYDLEGADTGREWIEIYNNSGDAVDLTNWKLYEAETNHKINLFRETDSFLLPANNYAVIADDPNKFLIDWPDFSGIIFDSSFSLNNIGETIVLRNSELIDVDNVIYSAERGANGDGNSLQKMGGEWKVGSPTPGTVNISANSQSQELQQQLQPQSQVVVGENDFVYTPPEKLPRIKAYAGEDRIVVAGANIEFRGQAFGLNSDPLVSARFLWTFGDGFSKEGQNIVHSYQYPGEYIVVLNVSSGEYSASDSFLTKVIPNQIFISELKTTGGGSGAIVEANPVDGGASWIELENKSKEEIDISGMQIKNGNQIFILPKSSRIRPNAFLVIPTSAVGFIIYPGEGSVELLYPGGFKADVFRYEGFPSGIETFNRDGDGKKTFISQKTPGEKNKEKITEGSSTSFSTSVGSVNERLKVQVVKPSIETEPVRSSEIENENENAKIAVAAVAETEPKSNMSIYLLAVAGLILFSGIAVFFIRRNRSI